MVEKNVMLQSIEYDRKRAVTYAHMWAYRRNPLFFDFEELGGDCTNFASQCVYAGAGVMNYTPVFGWYYIDSYQRTASWTGVEYFYNFMTQNEGAGPYMRLVGLDKIEPGDVIQLKLEQERFSHAPVVVAVGEDKTPDSILVAAHSYDCDYRPLSTYQYKEIRPLHVEGVRKPVPTDAAASDTAPANGASPNGASPNGAPPNGVPPNGVPPNGVPPNGVPPNGVPPNGVPQSGAPPSGAQRPQPAFNQNASRAWSADMNGARRW